MRMTKHYRFIVLVSAIILSGCSKPEDATMNAAPPPHPGAQTLTRHFGGPVKQHGKLKAVTADKSGQN